MIDYLNKNRNQIAVILAISLTYFYRVNQFIFPQNYQQDDVSELRVIFFENFSCALDKGDNHPLFTIFIWFLSKFFEYPEYILSSLIIILTISSIYILFNIFGDQFSIGIAIIFLGVLFFSQPIITYSLSLKQYALELYASAYSFRFFQKYLNTNEYKNSISKYCFVSVILTLFSFVNAIPFFLTIFFIFFNEKRINFNLIIFPFLAMLPFTRFIISKLQRVSGNGYWDDFFITNEVVSFQDFYENFYFLNSLFLKSLFVENLVPLVFPIYLLSVVIAFFQKDKLTNYSLLGVASIVLLSIIGFYPLGGGRTDILFIPYLLFLISSFANFLYLKFFNKKGQYLLAVIFALYITNGVVTTEVFYKDENVEPIIENIREKYNNDDALIIVTEDQFPSIIYYSMDLVDSVSFEIGDCTKTIPNISNILQFKNNSYFNNLGENKGDTSDVIQEKNQIILIGIELPGTNGKYRAANDLILKNGFIIDSQTKYENGLVSIKFIRDE